MIGDKFYGPGTMGNLIPQDTNLNKGEYKALENYLASALKNGADVYMKVEPLYKKGSFRPSYICVTYSISGEKSVRMFKNRS